MNERRSKRSTVAVEETLPVEKRKPFAFRAKSVLGFTKLLGKHPQLSLSVLFMIVQDVTARTGPIFALATKKLFEWDTEKTARWLMAYLLRRFLSCSLNTSRDKAKRYGLGMAIGPGVITAHNVKIALKNGRIERNLAKIYENLDMLTKF